MVRRQSGRDALRGVARRGGSDDGEDYMRSFGQRARCVEEACIRLRRTRADAFASGVVPVRLDVERSERRRACRPQAAREVKPCFPEPKQPNRPLPIHHTTELTTYAA